MPANLDEDARRTVVFVTTITSSVVIGLVTWAQIFVIPKLRRRIVLPTNTSNDDYRSSLLGGCLITISLMMILTIIFVLPLIYDGPLDPDSTASAAVASSVSSSSSINFCEEDFVHSRFIAEPANALSNLACYVPLALLGLVGPPSREWRKHTGGIRFVVSYVALFAIGLGSFALHALLTAWAQGGDEVPMLWFVAAASYCSVDISLSRGAKRLGTVVAATAAAATATYVLKRDDFTVFFLIFSAGVVMLVASNVWIVFGLDWESCGEKTYGDPNIGLRFRANILMPLAACTGYLMPLAQWTWVSEMLLCNSSLHNSNANVAWFLNRAVHPLWHYTSGLLAWMLLQLLIAAHGMQRGWGMPKIRWFAAPYVAFESLGAAFEKKGQ